MEVPAGYLSIIPIEIKCNVQGVVLGDKLVDELHEQGLMVIPAIVSKELWVYNISTWVIVVDEWQILQKSEIYDELLAEDDNDDRFLVGEILNNDARMDWVAGEDKDEVVTEELIEKLYRRTDPKKILQADQLWAVRLMVKEFASNFSL